MRTLFQEIGYGVRMLRKQPAFAIIAIATLALGIGANTAIFSVINAVLLRPLPYPHSEDLVLLRERFTGTSGFESGSVSYMNYMDWQASQRSFTGLALVRREGVNISGNDRRVAAERVSAARITANYLSVLGVPPVLGRDLHDPDDVPGAGKVVLLSEPLWRSRFGASPAVIGQRLTVDGVSREIVGVAPERVRFPRNSAVFIPLADLRANRDFLSRGNHESFSALGRLKPGVSLQNAAADLNTIAADLARRFPDSNNHREVSSKLFLEFAVGEYRQLLYLLLGAVACVLLIACANVANLQLARALSRRKEFAVRAALGAGRWQLTRQMLTETVVLAAVGGACAVIIALWSLDTIRALSPARVPRFQEASIDPRVILFTAAAVIITSLLVGLWPALRVASQALLANDLHDNGARGSDGGQPRRARGILVVAQVALAVVLLSGAGLTLRSFRRTQEVPLGFNPHNILSMTIALPEARYDTPEKIAQFYDQLLDKLKALPGVSSAALCSNAPFDSNEWDSSFHITGTPTEPSWQDPVSEMSIVTPDYFQVIGVPVLRGRFFGTQDVSGRPGVVVIDELAAQRFFPGQDPIGKSIDDPVTIDDSTQTPRALTIIGIVPHTRNNAPGEPIDSRHLAGMYFSASQFAKAEQNLMIRVTDGRDPHAVVPAVKREIATLDSEQAVSDVSTMEESISDSLTSRRLTMTLLAVFAGLALCLASIGLYGVMALTVTQRTRELGIRLALGAHKSDVFRLVLGQGMLLVAIGLGCGLVVALSTGRGLNSILYDVGVWDAPAVGGAVITLATVALFACWLPALRATRVDPIVALRAE